MAKTYAAASNVHAISNNKAWWQMDNFLALAIAALGSSTATAALTHWLRSRKESSERDFARSSDVIQELMARDEAKEKAILEYQQQLFTAMHDLEAAREANRRYELTRVPGNGKALLEGWVETLPWPSWIHEVGRNNWFLNDAYAHMFHVERSSFWKPVNIFALYPEEQAVQYVEEDMTVLVSGVPMVIEVEIPTFIMRPPGKDNPTIRCEVVKRPWKVENRMYVFGSARPLEGERAVSVNLRTIANFPAHTYKNEGK